MHRKKLALILSVVAVASIVVGYLRFVQHNKVVTHNNDIQHDLVDISKQNPTVQTYLQQHPNAEYEITKCYIMGDGKFYTVDDEWNLKEYRGNSGKPLDRKDHYCWLVGWHDPTSWIEHMVSVFIDKNVLNIVFVEEIW